MRLLKILGYPALALASIAIILISGEASGGTYLQFFIMNLVSLQLFAVVGALGLVMLFCAFAFYPNSRSVFNHSILNILGMLLVAASVILFLYRLPWENSYQTYSGIPLLTLILAAVCSLSFLFNNISSLIRIGK